MAGPFVTGGVDIPLSVRIAGIQEGITKAKAELDKLGIKTQEVAKKTQQAGKATQQGLSKAGVAVSGFANKIGNAGVRLLSLQLILQQFGSRAGTGRFGKEVRAASDSLTVFVSGISVAPGPIGLFIGSIGALVTALFSLSGLGEKAKKTIQGIADVSKKAAVSVDALIDAVIGLQVGEDAQTKLLGIQRKELQELLKQRSQEKKLRQELNVLLKTGEINQFKFRQETTSLDVSMTLLEGKIKSAITEFKRLNQAVLDQASIRTLSDQMDIFSEQLSVNQLNMDAGLITPLDNATKGAAAAQAAITLLFTTTLRLSDEARTRQAKNLKEIGEELKKTLETFQNQISEIGIDQLLDEAIAGAAELEPVLAARDRKRAKDAAEATALAFEDSFSGPFARTLGQSVFDGIIQGKEAMEVVADVGRGLFSNFLSQSIENFQSGMISAFKSIAGAGGEALGSVLTGLVGLAGAFLSDRGKGGEQSFEGVQSAIESSQAVRGIVAGPTNVAIAAVGDDLRRALAPSQALLEAQLRELIAIRTNTSGGGGAAGPLPFAGSVATP